MILLGLLVDHAISMGLATRIDPMPRSALAGCTELQNGTLFFFLAIFNDEMNFFSVYRRFAKLRSMDGNAAPYFDHSI